MFDSSKPNFRSAADGLKTILAAASAGWVISNTHPDPLIEWSPEFLMLLLIIALYVAVDQQDVAIAERD